MCTVAHAAQQCEQLRDIANGRVSVSGVIIGSTATYTCNKGYFLVGSSTRRCQTNAEWSGEEPFCKRKVNLLCPWCNCTTFKRYKLVEASFEINTAWTGRLMWSLFSARTRMKLTPCVVMALLWKHSVSFYAVIDCGQLRDIRNGSIYQLGMSRLLAINEFVCVALAICCIPT